MIETAVYDTKPYDRDYLARAASAKGIAWRFHEIRLCAETDSAAEGAKDVCIFVNDHADRACLEMLAAHGVRLLVLRCAGHNNVDLVAARELGLNVVRVPAYSPHAVAGVTTTNIVTLENREPFLKGTILGIVPDRDGQLPGTLSEKKIV